MVNVPNAITVIRLALVPVIVVLLHRGEHGTAFWLFIVSALSDLVDGPIARHWKLQTRFGAVADPLADKLTMFGVTLLLALQHALPWWFAVALVLRDAVIVAGAVAYRLVVGQIEMAPSRISKLNTALQFLLLLAVLAMRAGHLPGGTWVDMLVLATLVTIVLSGADYVLVWGRKAAQARRAAASAADPQTPPR